MAPYFLDSSALVKRYVREVGSPWIRALTDPAAANACWLATVTQVELAAALYLRVRTGTLALVQARRAVGRFRRELRTHFRPGAVTAAVLRRAMHLVAVHPLRAYDAVQLASALVLHAQQMALGLPPLTFLSADRRLSAAGSAEGLTVDDPNLHP
jgi:predicted nucleic acid-binding protein